MAKLDHLKVKNCPKAFEQFAEQHNQLVDLIATLEGAWGIDVQIAHTPKDKISTSPNGKGVKSKPRGKILISGLSQALSQLPGSGSSSGVGDYTANVIALEVLTAGLSRTNVNYCASNSSSVKTILMS